MYHPVHSSTSWTDTDPNYTEMSPLLKTLGHHSSSYFHSNFNNSSKYTCESCSDYTYAHFFLRAYVGYIPVAVYNTKGHVASVIYLSVVTQYSQQLLVTMRY